MQIIAASYNGDDLLASGGKLLVDSNLNGWIDLNDLTYLANSGEGGQLDNLTAPAAAGASTMTLAMTIQFRSGSGNEYQGDSVVMSIPFALNQDSGQ